MFFEYIGLFYKIYSDMWFLFYFCVSDWLVCICNFYCILVEYKKIDGFFGEGVFEFRN